MTIPSLEAEAVGWATKNVILLFAGTIIACVALFIGYQVFIAPMNAKHDVAAAKGGQAISEAGKQGAQDAGKIINQNGQNNGKTDDQHNQNINVILKAPGASALLDPALDDATRRSICLYHSAAGLPECQRLLNAGP